MVIPLNVHRKGDGFINYQFARLLSQNYQGLKPLDPPPSYAPIPDYPFDADKYSGIRLPDQENYYPLRGVHPLLEPGKEKFVLVNIRLTAAQILQVQAGVLAQCPGAAPTRLSRQDILAALLAHCMNKTDASTPPIRRINTVVNVSILVLLPVRTYRVYLGLGTYSP